ncbi:GNAT family N-acetyltransferase [Lawsonibacter hominis]|jgi:acetyltransferases|uniref:GNAT family N-acetyltransferase n=1 Tax=Lawsonibacter hominis TaxID=2763053 RepID=A0A8J6JDQ0_9FIRM|nr:GNAT family N-acetyltransferase [Lawsonibacter hominis]MBC5732465.1 GNAT family N-acetyltransferase [Lawsonibacter hominis]
MNELSIRHAEPGDLDPLMKIETDSFPPAEAASCATLAYRISDLAEWFLVGMLDGVPVGFLNGLTTRKAFIEDDIFEPGNSHPDGKTLAILSLAVSPDFRCKGLAAALLNSCLETARQRGLERVVLTCKDHLIHYYQRFGFMEHGISRSVHGGAVWHDMECRLL